MSRSKAKYRLKSKAKNKAKSTPKAKSKTVEQTKEPSYVLKGIPPHSYMRIYQVREGQIVDKIHSNMLDLIEKLWKFDENEFWEDMQSHYPHPDNPNCCRDGFYFHDHRTHKRYYAPGSTNDEAFRAVLNVVRDIT